MAAVKYIGKWNYLKASEEDEDKFADEEPDSDIDIKLPDLKAALTLFQKKVCTPELPPCSTPAASLGQKALQWLISEIDKKREDDENIFKKELLEFVVKCFESGPNPSHIELIDYTVRQGGLDGYLDELKGDDLRKFLRTLKRKYSYKDSEVSAEDYADNLSSTICNAIFSRFESEQLDDVMDECAALYMYCESLDVPKPLYTIYEDIASTLQRKCSDGLEEKANKLKPIIPWKTRIKQVEGAILKEPEMDEDKADKHYDILKKGIDYLKVNPDEYVSHLEDYMRVFAALSKCPDTKATRRIMYIITLVSEICTEKIKNNRSLFEKYSLVITDIIKSSQCPLAMAKSIEYLSEKVLEVAAGQSAKQAKFWAPYIAALVGAPSCMCVEAGENILKNKRKYLDWKENKPGVLEIIKSLVNSPPGDEDHNDSDTTPWLINNRHSSFLEELMKQLKSVKISGDLQIQKFILESIGTCLESRTEGRFDLAHALMDHMDLKADKKLAMPLMTRIEKLFQDEEFDWQLTNVGMTAFNIFNNVLNDHKSGKELGAYNALFLTIFKISLSRDHWNHDADSLSVYGYILSSTLLVFCNLHRESKTADELKPILGELVKCLRHENEDIASNIGSCFQFIAMSSPDLFAPHLGEIVKIYIETQDSNLANVMSTCYPKNPEAINGKLSDFLGMLDEADSSQKSSIMDLLSKIAQSNPKSFTQDIVDKLLRGGYIEDIYTCGTVLMLLQNVAAKNPQMFEKHLDYLMTLMNDISTRSQIPPILIEITKLNKKYKKKVFDKLISVMKASNGDYITIAVLLNSVRILGIDDRDLLATERGFIEWIRDNVIQLKESANHILDVIDGKTVDDITDLLGEHQKGLENLDTRVTNTENDVTELGQEVDKQGQNIGQIRQDVDKQEGRIDELEEVVDGTVLKVEEIDNKTLDNAPTWSRDVSKLLNPEADQDWRLLAQRLGYSPEDIRGWATQHDPCMSMLSEWFATHKTSEATKAVLKNLEEMNRLDASEIVGRALQAVENVVQDEPLDYENPPPIFISYQWGHQPEVRMLRKHLEMAGFESWMDIGQMGGGDKLYAKIDEGIRAAKVVVCCVTEKYAKSPNCNREVNLAVNLGKPIIPILLENVAWPPPGAMGPIFGEYIYIRFFEREAKKDPKDERFWPGNSFQELLMQLCFMKLIPEENKIKKEYKNWWLPVEEEIVIPKKNAGTKAATQVAKTEESNTNKVSPQVFISYQWGIQPQVKLLYKRLSGMGYHCWMDIYQMGGGDSLYDQIDRGVRGCTVVISCVTEKYAKSANCRREVSLADAIKKPIIPLLLEETTWPPSGPMSMVFTQLLYIQFTDPKLQQSWTGPKFDELMEKLSLHLPKIGQVSPKDNNSNTAQSKRAPQAPRPNQGVPAKKASPPPSAASSVSTEPPTRRTSQGTAIKKTTPPQTAVSTPPTKPVQNTAPVKPTPRQSEQANSSKKPNSTPPSANGTKPLVKPPATNPKQSTPPEPGSKQPSGSTNGQSDAKTKNPPSKLPVRSKPSDTTSTPNQKPEPAEKSKPVKSSAACNIL